jgi:hypothetical protein
MQQKPRSRERARCLQATGEQLGSDEVEAEGVKTMVPSQVEDNYKSECFACITNELVQSRCDKCLFLCWGRAGVAAHRVWGARSELCCRARVVAGLPLKRVRECWNRIKCRCCGRPIRCSFMKICGGKCEDKHGLD